ncbi:hypothetical protein [[Flexibacter] sp. ATCC 35208]|uniref:hypothetical protein n=1 Tax=[Flexibacter] sp. ATCC 35208 TaxID=1936242 RepID=UPI001C6FCCC5|nr:hypothetical protein [[Flexibacter] sp. ATCC 35208]
MMLKKAELHKCREKNSAPFQAGVKPFSNSGKTFSGRGNTFSGWGKKNCLSVGQAV